MTNCNLLWTLIDFIIGIYTRLKQYFSRANVLIQYWLVQNRVLSLSLYSAETKQLTNVYSYETTFQIFLYLLAIHLKLSKPILLNPKKIIISPHDIIIISYIDHDRSKVNLILDKTGVNYLSHKKPQDKIADWIAVDAVVDYSDRTTIIDLTQFINQYKVSFTLSKLAVENVWDIAEKHGKIENGQFAKIKHLETINSNFEIQVWESTQIFIQ